MLIRILALVLMFALTTTVGCRQDVAAPTAAEAMERSFDDAEMRDIKIDENREQRRISLSGRVASVEQWQRADDMARQHAPGWTIENNIEVEGVGRPFDGQIPGQQTGSPGATQAAPGVSPPVDQPQQAAPPEGQPQPPQGQQAPQGGRPNPQ